MSQRYFAAIYRPKSGELQLLGPALNPEHGRTMLTDWLSRQSPRTRFTPEGMPMIQAEEQPLILADQTVPLPESEEELDHLVQTDVSVHMLANLIFRRVTDELVEFIKDVAKLPESGHPIDEGIALAERASFLLDRR